MKYVNQLLNQLILIVFSLKKINLFKAFYNQKKGSKNIIWIFPGWPMRFITYFGTAAVIQDLSLLYSCINNLKDYRIVVGSKIGKHRNKNIYYSFTDRFNPYKFESNSRYIQSIIFALNNQGCITYPNIEELRLWEDKEYMYSIFKKENISHPYTVNIKINDSMLDKVEALIKDFDFPILIKEHFGNQSKGLYFIKSKPDLKEQLLKLEKNNVSSASIQQLIKAESDHRVIIINGSIQQHYERIRSKEVFKNNDWKTTSTKYGTILKFDSIEEKYSKILENYTKILNISNAAFDVIIKNGELYVLEVSTSYYTNPKPVDDEHLPYKEFKKKMFKHNKLKVDIVFKLKENWINGLIRE